VPEGGIFGGVFMRGGPVADDPTSFQAILQTPPDAGPGAPPAHARAVDLELAPPQPSGSARADRNDVTALRL